MDSFDLDIECPNCEKPFTISTGQIGSSVKCPHCQEQIDLVDDGFSDKMKSAEKQIDDMLKNLKF